MSELEKYVKLTNESCIHNGFEFKEGLNVDTLAFNPVKECLPGGLYFCRYKDFSKWIDYKENDIMKYMWDVEIPEGEKVVDLGDKLKAHKIILSNKRSIWDDNELCLEAVKQYGRALEYVKEEFQTEDVCLEAVKQNGYALEYVKAEFKYLFN